MLLKVDIKNKFRSMYECDRCGRVVDVKHKITIYSQKYLCNSKKYCDLCLRCFSALERGLKKGKKNGYISKQK